jgi:hypothetical protein
MAGGQASSNPGTIIFSTDDGNVSNVSERARFDASGNFLVGKTSSNTATAGIELRATDQVTITRSGNTPLIINRLSSDGELVKFQKDGTNIGYIGNASADFAVSNSTATNGAGISLQNNLFVTPMKGGSKDTSSAVSLGNTSYTWKDIYLGGGAYLGGTGTANKLDDYEEGTWTPSFSNGVSGSGYSRQNGRYTKVGNKVFFEFDLEGNGLGSTTNQMVISGLPFLSNSSAPYGGGVMNYTTGIYTSEQLLFHIGGNDQRIYLYQLTGSNFLGTEAVNVNKRMLVHGHYTTA